MCIKTVESQLKASFKAIFSDVYQNSGVTTESKFRGKFSYVYQNCGVTTKSKFQGKKKCNGPTALELAAVGRTDSSKINLLHLWCIHPPVYVYPSLPWWHRVSLTPIIGARPPTRATREASPLHLPQGFQKL